ncbi:hypothetical protein [Mycoplasma sp. P36-A1]|uniref:hypothetical protein n=1 Tax=Mycoplasma sp. P36-A1 TaxID=3252900 RepID=UPI003C2E5752
MTDKLVSPEAMSIVLRLKVRTCENIIKKINRQVREDLKIQTTQRWVLASRVAKVRDCTVETLVKAQDDLDKQKSDNPPVKSLKTNKIYV